MPHYDYRCQECGHKFVLFYKTYVDYDAATRACPRCESPQVKRTISKVIVARGPSFNLDALEDDDSMLDDLENADPATLGRFMRQMGDEMGEDLGDEFNEVVGRLEKGESPEDIEASLPPMDDGPGAGPANMLPPE